MLQKSLLSFSIVLALIACAQAQDAAVQPTVQVTASRIAQTVDASLADVSVITRGDIDTSGAADLYDLLRLQAGIDVARSGGAGAQTSVFMRGTNSNHVLVLIDGVRVASANTGAYAWEQLPLDAVERVEIVRGPRTSYWGSDAIGGVIQIFTRKLQGPMAAAQYGSYQDASGSAGFGDWGDRGGFSIVTGIRHTTGFPAASPANYYDYDGLDDGYRATNIAAQGSYLLGAGQTLSGSILHSDADVEFPNGSTTQGRSAVTEQSVGANLDGRIAPWWSERISIGQTLEDLTTPVYAELLTSHRDSLSWQNDFLVADQQHLIAGIDYYREQGFSENTEPVSVVYDEYRHNTGVFVGWQGQQGALDWELAGRHDDNSQFGDASTGSLALGYALTSWLRGTGSFGQGFRSPDFNEQFSPGFGGYFAGNPDLHPERSHSSELGLEATPLPDLSVKLVHYRTDISDLIDFTGSQDQAENVEKARIEGTELSARWHQGPWSIDASATWQNPRDLTDDSELLRRAKQKANILAMRSFSDRISAGVEVVSSGETRDIAATAAGGSASNGGYTIYNARLNFVLSRDWQLHLRGENLGDHDYTVVQGYATPGRSGWAEIVWQPH
ncbi:MAG: TonB-dependent receptor [Rudaea sp.]|nr:TonB-dependent receptor [Rudaea sp.]